MDILNQFGVQPILLAAQVVNFLILLFILKKFLYGPILKILGERKKKIEDSLKNAEEIQRKLLETEQQKQKELAKTQAQIQKMLDEAKEEIEVMKTGGRLQAEEMAAQIIKHGEEQSKADAEKLEQQLMERFSEIVALGMEKVSGKVFDKGTKKQIIERELRNLS